MAGKDPPAASAADSPALRARLEREKRAQLAHLLIRAGRLMSEVAFERARADPSFARARPAHLTVFPHLDLDGTRLAELARRMGVTKQAAGQLVDDLEGLGLLERRPDPADGRAKLICFTDEGRAAIFRGLEVLAETEEEVLGGLPPPRRAALREDLLHIVALLEGARRAE